MIRSLAVILRTLAVALTLAVGAMVLVSSVWKAGYSAGAIEGHHHAQEELSWYVKGHAEAQDSAEWMEP